jgi:hypothetical protein
MLKINAICKYPKNPTIRIDTTVRRIFENDRTIGIKYDLLKNFPASDTSILLSTLIAAV